MRAVGIRELKSRLSQYVKLVAAGETILVTDRDHVVAELGPPRAERHPMVADALLADAVRNGWLTPALSSGEGEPPRQPVAPWEDLAAEIDDDRGER